MENKTDNESTKNEHSQKHYILYYSLVPDILIARSPYQKEHMRLLNEFSSRGLVFVGVEVVGGFPAVFLFQSASDEIVKEWLDKDPYFNNNLVVKFRYNQIILVAGSLFENNG